MITAEVHSDDRVLQVTFDATSYFQQAADADIIALAACDWGGDYPADAVAQHAAENNRDVAKLFEYLEAIADVPSKKDQRGFECSVESDSVMAWLRVNRPGLFTRLAIAAE